MYNCYLKKFNNRCLFKNNKMVALHVYMGYEDCDLISCTRFIYTDLNFLELNDFEIISSSILGNK